MDSMLVLEQGGNLSETLRDMFHDAGSGVTVCSDIPLALALLQVAPTSLAVLLSDSGPTEEWKRILAAVPGLPPHAYVLLSTRAQQAPWQWNPHTEAFVPVVPMPFDVDRLLAQVADTVGQIQLLPSLMTAV
jgi:DNA-binding NtrC family response regulator